MCHKRSSHAILKTSSAVSVYFNDASKEPFFDPVLVGLIFERRREICLELFETLVRFHAEIFEPHYEVIRDTLLEADVPVQDQYDQACSFFLDDAKTRFDQVVMSTSYVVPLDQRFFRCYERLQKTVAILWNIYSNYIRRFSMHHDLGLFKKLCEHPGASSENQEKTEHQLLERSLQDFHPESEIVQIDTQRTIRLPDLLFKTCKQVEALVQFLEFYQYVKERRIKDKSVAQYQTTPRSKEKFACSRQKICSCAQIETSRRPGDIASRTGESHQTPKVSQEGQSLPLDEKPILEQLRIQLENTCRNSSINAQSLPTRDSELDILMIQKMESLYRFMNSEISLRGENNDQERIVETDMQALGQISPQIEDVIDTELMTDNALQDSLPRSGSRNEPDIKNCNPNSHDTPQDNKQQTLEEEPVKNVVYELIDTSLPILERSILGNSRQSSLDHEDDTHSANTSYVPTDDLQTHPADVSSRHETQETYESIDDACFEELLISDITDASSASEFKFIDEDI